MTFSYMYILCAYYIHTCTCRSGKYTLNTSTGSDGDLLLNSPGRDKDVNQPENSDKSKHDSTAHNTTTPSTSHDPTATPSSNGLEAPAATSPSSSDSSSSPEEQRKVLNSNENNCTDSVTTTTTAVSGNGGCNSEAGSGGEGRKVNSKERLPDGEMDREKELQDNFK